jgi:peroxiredoxin
LQVHYNTYTLELEDTPMDIGYASEKVKLYDETGKVHTIAGQNGKTQLIISAPFINKTFKDELQKIDAILSEETNENLECHLVMANETHQDPQMKNFDFLIDKEGEFGDWYGVRLQGETLEGEFTKSLMLISKDGALFYDEYPQDISNTFNEETLLRKIVAADTCYTGKGCH